MSKASPSIFGRQPARWLGLIVTLIVAIGRVLVGDDLISQDQADAVANAAQKIVDVALIFAPFITTELVRTQVTPKDAPQLEHGTTVQVTSPNTGAVIKTETV